MLLSYKKQTTASSVDGGNVSNRAVDENVQTCWRAKGKKPGEWITLDLGEVQNVHAVQVNFADVDVVEELPENTRLGGMPFMRRYIDEAIRPVRWFLEASTDGKDYRVLCDKRQAVTSLANDLVVEEAGFPARFIRLTVYELPFGQAAAVSGLRVFGRGNGRAPEKASGVSAKRFSGTDARIRWDMPDAMGCNVLWGHRADKLYHSCMVFDASEYTIGALVNGQEYFVRIDTFNANGIAEGDVIPLLKH